MFAAENRAEKKSMKTKIVRQFIKCFSLAALFACAVFLSAVIADAQTKRIRKSKRQPPVDAEFSVPCAEALRIGLEQVEKLHDADITRRLNGDPGDSDTELLIEKNAFENYLKCRRADTEKKFKKLAADECAKINKRATAARRIAEMRVDLIYGVLFDERYDDPVNYVVSQKAVILVENFKADLTRVYSLTGDSNARANAEIAERNVAEIGKLLKRIEKVSLESDEASKFPAFKTEIEKNLAETAGNAGTEKRVSTAFLVRLLRMHLPDEN